MVNKINEVGNVYHLLTVISSAESNKHQKSRWTCVCSCGKEVTVLGASLRNGKTKSCGCMAKKNAEKHGLRDHLLYAVYHGMIQRCYNKKHKAWMRYGGKGIKVCWRWHIDNPDGFKNFFEDMLPTYKKGLWLGRVDNEGDYSPENCRWETPVQQANNRGNTLWTEWGIPFRLLYLQNNPHKLKYGTAYLRLRKGWSPERALYTPLLKTYKT